MSSVVAHGDLAISIFAICLAAGFLFWTSKALVHRFRPWVSNTTALITLALTLVFAATMHGQLTLVRLLPVSNAIVLGNWLPLGAAVLAGSVAGQVSVPAWRRAATIGMLTGLAWYTIACDLFAPAPQPDRPRFLDGICMQTNADSCSACCAVALLTEHGIPARESEMMELCLTRRGGTPELGLYRGLKLKTQDTPWDVEILSCTPEALRQPDMYPALLLVDARPSYDGTDQPRWRPRKANHAVVVYGITEHGSIAVGNPSAGRKRWTFDHLRQSWLGDGLRLMRRE